MRIAVIAPPWLPVPPPAYGGTELMLDRLCRGLDQAGHEVLLATTGDSACPVRRAAVYERAESLRLGMSLPEIRHVLHSYEAANDYDVIHDHTLVGPLYASRRDGPPVVTTNHGPFNEELCDLYGAVAADVAVIAISHAQARTAGGVPITRVIHHGLDADAYPVGAGDGGYFLFLGRMAPEKGAKRAAVVARRAGVPLVLAAKMRDPLEVAYFNDQVRPLLSGDIEYVGEMGGRAKLDLLAGALGLLNPIRWPEPFGLVMIEALACGTPVLAFREGAAPEIVADGVTGFLCDDVDDMADRAGHVDTLDRTACRHAVETHFSTGRMVADHLEVYRQVVADRG